jgi:phage terminase Nu1 subunit (DNA packaging protein)
MKAPHVTRRELARVLGCSSRTVERLEAAGVLTPATRPQRGTPSRYDLAVCVAAFVAHRSQPTEAPDAASARDAYYQAQTALAVLRLARERRELLPRADVVEDGQATIRAVVTHLRALPARLLQAGAIDQAAVPQAESIIADALGELASWRTRIELLAVAGEDTDL